MINHIVPHVDKPREKKHAVKSYGHFPTNETFHPAHPIPSRSIRRYSGRLTEPKPTHKAQLSFGTTTQLLNISSTRKKLTKEVSRFQKELTANPECKLFEQRTTASDQLMHWEQQSRSTNLKTLISQSWLKI